MSRYHFFVALLYTLFESFLTQRFFLPTVAAGWLVLYGGGRAVWQLFLAARLAVWLFWTYFGRMPDSVDIKLLWLHPFETIETLKGMTAFFALPLAGWGVLAFLGLWLPDKRLKIIPLTAAAGALWLSFSPLSSNGQVEAIQADAPPKLTRRSDLSVVLILGESLGYDADIVRRFVKLGLQARPLVAGATATDTSVALLLNGELDLRKLTVNDRANLFALAKANGYATYFCSAQPTRWLINLRPYLGQTYVEVFHTAVGEGKSWDTALLNCLKLAPNRPAFIVLQQIGEHAPYTYYPPPHADDPAENYRRSLDYTFDFYRRVVAWAKAQNRPVVVLGTADHGELRGQGGRWGHNRFDERVVRVPFWIVSNLSDPLPYIDTVRCHHDLYRLIAWLMGYDYVPLSPKRIPIWGTMLSGEDGMRLADGLKTPAREDP